MDELGKVADRLVQNPLDLLDRPDDVDASARALLELSFRLGVEEGPSVGPLRAIVAQGYDVEGVWAQLDMQTDALLEQAERALGQLKELKKHPQKVKQSEEGGDDGDAQADPDYERMLRRAMAQPSDDDEEGESGDGSSGSEGGGADEEDDEEEEEEEEEDDGEAAEEAVERSRPSEKKGEVEDGFFSFADMDEFLDEADAEDAEGEGGDEDEEEDDDDKEDDDEEDDDEEDEDEGMEPKAPTRHSKEQQRLAEQVAQLEEEAMAAKPWYLLGETSASARPKDSLLDAELDYDVAARAAPLPSVEATQKLEDMIRQRIADLAFDDPERKDPPRDDRLAAEDNAAALDRMDDQLAAAGGARRGLGDEYAERYAGESMSARREKEQQKQEEEVRDLFQQLSRRLDALSNFHYTPRPAAAGAGVEQREAVPAISVEEITPVTMSGAAAVAPEEVAARGRGRAGVLVSKDELAPEEKAARRRARKSARRKRQSAQRADARLADRLSGGAMGNPHARKQVLDALKAGRGGSAVTVVDAPGAGDSKLDRAVAGGKAGSGGFFAHLQAQARADAGAIRDEAVGKRRGGGERRSRKHKSSADRAALKMKLG